MKIKNLITILSITCIACILFAFKNYTVKTDSEVKEIKWENLKVLPKDISEEKLKELMRGYNKALGVKCNHCHAEGENGKLDFASDQKKEKDYARHMIEMTKNINSQYFNWNNDPNPENIETVNCTMCHRGNTKATK